MKLIRTLLVASAGLAFVAPTALAAPPAPEAPVTDGVAQEDPEEDPLGEDEPAPSDDGLDDILGPAEDRPATVGEERRAIEDEADRDNGTEEVKLPPAKRKIIKTIVPKYFMKIGRFEATPYVGMVTNDPFIRRILFGADLAYHFTELFAFEVQGSYSPNFGEGDWKPVTRQITGDNQVSPEISRMMWHATGNFNFSPFYGKVATAGKTQIVFDLYGTFGAGVVGTSDDLELIGNEGDPRAEATRTQVHPALTFGGGLRVAFNKSFALRFEVRSLSYIGVLESTKLELKNNLALMLGGSVFFGRRPE